MAQEPAGFAVNDSNDAVAVVTDLSHFYGSVAALDRVSISLPSGRLVGLIGPDGVGKSSLLAILAGAREIQQGEVRVLGVTSRAPLRARRCARGSPICRRGSAKTFILT